MFRKLGIMLACLLVCSASTRADELLLRAAKAITLVGPPLQPAAVLIEDGKIKQIAESIEPGEGARVVDLGAAVLMPGLVNAYSQMGVSGGSSEFTREITPDFDLQSAVDWDARAFRESLADGTTTAGIAPGTDNVIAGISFVVKTAGSDLARRVVRGQNGLVVTLASDPRNRNRSRVRPDSIYVRQPTNRMGVVWMLRDELERARREPNAASDVLVGALAGQRRLFCVSRTHFDVESMLRLSDEYDFAPVLIGGQEAHMLASELSERKIPVILGPLSTSLSSGVEGVDPVWNRAGTLHQAGIRLALSGNALLEQARFAVRFGLPRGVALRAITLVPARLLGVQNRVGSLAAGHDADLVVLTGDPLEFTTNVKAVIVDGVIFEEGSDF